MPNIPTTGAAGQIPFTGKPSAGPQDHGAPSPAHGAAGGYEIPMPYRGNPPVAPGETGLSWPDPEVGSGKPNTGPPSRRLAG